VGQHPAINNLHHSLPKRPTTDVRDPHQSAGRKYLADLLVRTQSIMGNMKVDSGEGVTSYALTLLPLLSQAGIRWLLGFDTC